MALMLMLQRRRRSRYYRRHRDEPAANLRAYQLYNYIYNRVPMAGCRPALPHAFMAFSLSPHSVLVHRLDVYARARVNPISTSKSKSPILLLLLLLLSIEERNENGSKRETGRDDSAFFPRLSRASL